MTLLAVARALWRFWPITLVGLLVALGSAVTVRQTPGLAFARVSVYFSSVQGPARPNKLVDRRSGVVDIVSVVQRRITQELPPPSVSSTNVTIVDQGVSTGWAIILPNSGGQWERHFSSPYLDVQVVDPDPGKVRAETLALPTRIEAVLDAVQDEASVDDADRVTASLSPPPAVEVHGARGPVTRAAAVLGILALAVTAALVDSLDRRLPRGMQPRRPLLRVRRGTP